jgi:hypothetical protein
VRRPVGVTDPLTSAPGLTSLEARMSDFQFSVVLMLLFAIGADTARSNENRWTRSAFALVMFCFMIFFLIRDCASDTGVLIG